MVDNLDTEYHMKKALKDAGAILVFTKSELKKLGYEYHSEHAN
jgi:predicted Zn-ribbon and HTH transcriptional regulator